MDDRVSLYEQPVTSTVNTFSTNPLSQANQAFLQDVYEGLSQPQKTLPCKFFYDDKGSKLFEKICELPEYYITRTELALLESIKAELAELIGKNASIIEPGAGAGIKIRTLLRAIDNPESYVPMDISEDFLFYSAQVIQQEFPDIKIMPIKGDFSRPVKWLENTDNSNRVVFFPGSTIGNFEEQQAVEFLKNMNHLVGKNGALIIGVDLLKEQNILEAAYNDSQNITAAFNKNLLVRINQQLSANFELDQFKHVALLNHQYQRVEMHLVSQQEQQVKINGRQFNFLANESIHTENSHKYSIESFLKIAKQAGLKGVKHWVDDQKMFSVHYLVPK